jgi:endogenous inhibitor of DNA gyrase (YacG/DUF329 family)
MRHRCPICHKPTNSEKDADFPFCSERCRLTDLGNWATEKYRIAAPLFDESETEDLPTDESENSSEKDSDDHVQ